MTRIIVHIIFLLILIVISTQPKDLPKVQEKRSRQGRVENVLCDYRVSSITFKCNLEYQKIKMKVEMEALKAKHICMDLMERAREKCKDQDEVDCAYTTKRMKTWCENRQDEIKIYQLKSRKLIGDVCKKAASDFKQNCPNHDFKLPRKQLRNSESERPTPTHYATETTSIPAITVHEELEKPKPGPHKSKIQEIIDFIYGDKQHSMNKQDLISFVDKILQNNEKPGKPKQKLDRSDFAEYYKLLTLPNIQTIIAYIFGENKLNIPNKDLVAFVHKVFGIRPDVPTKPPIIHENRIHRVEPEPQTIIEFIFGETPQQIPSHDQALYIQHLFDNEKDKHKTEAPEKPKPLPTEAPWKSLSYNIPFKSEEPVKPKLDKDNTNIEGIVDYIFERLKYKIDKHYEVVGKPKKFNVPSIVSYLLGRYKQKSEKHKLNRNLPHFNLPNGSKYSKPAKNQKNHKNKFDISFIYKVIDELVSQEPGDHVTLNKAPTAIDGKNGMSESDSHPQKVDESAVSPIQFSMPTDSDFEEELEDEDEIELEKPENQIQQPSTIKVKTKKPKKIVLLLTKPHEVPTKPPGKPKDATQPSIEILEQIAITPIFLTETTVKPTEPSVVLLGASEQATGPSAHATEASAHATEASAHATEASAHATEASAHATEASVKATDATGPSAPATEPSAKVTGATEPSVKATDAAGPSAPVTGASAATESPKVTGENPTPTASAASGQSAGTTATPNTPSITPAEGASTKKPDEPPSTPSGATASSKVATGEPTPPVTSAK